MSCAIHLWPGYTKKTGRGEGASETKARVTQDVDDAFEALLQGQPDLSLKMESDLEEVLRIAELIKSELDVASGISELERLDRRIEFIEDRFEEPEAELYSRPSLFGPHFLVVDFCISRPRARRGSAREFRQSDAYRCARWRRLCR